MSLTEQKVDTIARILLSESPADYDLAMDDLRRLMESPEEVRTETVTALIHKLLAQVGVPTSTVGHMYLVDAIRIVVEDPAIMRHITQPGGLMDKVGGIHGRSADAIARAIRISIENAWNHGNHEFQDAHFPVRSPTTLIPTLAGFISRAANMIMLQMEQT